MAFRRLLLVFGLISLLGGGAAAQTDTIFLDRWHFYKQGIVGLYDLEGNFNPGRYTWSILTPSQPHIPGLPMDVDPNRIQPYSEIRSQSQTKSLSSLIYKNCQDSDRCEFSFPKTESGPATTILIRLAGIHTPRIKATCEQETLLGEQAKNLLHEHLSSAVHIELQDATIYRKEVSGRLVVDDQDLSELLVTQGFAVFYRGEDKDWCS